MVNGSRRLSKWGFVTVGRISPEPMAVSQGGEGRYPIMTEEERRRPCSLSFKQSEPGCEPRVCFYRLPGSSLESPAL